MKKFYLILALALSTLTAGAQNLQFLVKGQPIENNARVDLAAYLDESDPTRPLYNPELFLKSAVSGSAEATVVFTKGECIPALDAEWEKGGELQITFCSFDGQCQTVNPGQTATKNGSVTVGESNMQIELVYSRIGFSQEFSELKTNAEFTVSCKVGSDEVTATFFIDNTASLTGIEADANAPKEYFDLQGRKVTSPAEGLYIVRQGSKVSKQYIR